MRRNLIVLGGVAIVVYSKAFLPLIASTVDGVVTHLSPPLFFNTILLGAVLLFMLFRWAGRGAIWIILGLFGAFIIPKLHISIVQVFDEIIANMSSPLADSHQTASVRELTYLPGMYSLIFGYLLIAGGGIWDLAQKRETKLTSTNVEAKYQAQPNTKARYFECNFTDGRREVVNFPKNDKATIGCDSKDDIRTNPDNSTNSQVIIKRAKKLYFLDVLDTSFPTMLNSQLITKARKLSDGDIIEVGDASISIIISY